MRGVVPGESPDDPRVTRTVEASLPEPFSLRMEVDGPEVTVAPVGALDLVSADVLAREVGRLQGSGCGRIVIDLRRVGFLDSTGLRVLLSLRNDAKRHGHGLSLMAGPAAVQRIFRLTATYGLFDWRER